MSRKRRNTSSPESEPEPALKRCGFHNDTEWHSDSDEDANHEAPHVDEASGQTGAFPGLGRNNNELFYGPANDGIDYLRMVR
jgi:regulator of vacuolar morphogenesis